MRSRLVTGLLLFTATPAWADDLKTLKLEKTILLEGKPGRFDHLALDSKGERLLVANLSNDSLDIVDLKAGKMVKQITGQKKAQGVAFALWGALGEAASAPVVIALAGILGLLAVAACAPWRSHHTIAQHARCPPPVSRKGTAMRYYH